MSHLPPLYQEGDWILTKFIGSAHHDDKGYTVRQHLHKDKDYSTVIVGMKVCPGCGVAVPESIQTIWVLSNMDRIHGQTEKT